MGKSANTVVFSGNLGKDPEVTYTPTGTAICKFSIAVNDRKKGKDGAWADVTYWLRATCFGKTAENAGQYLQKGKPVLVSGKLEVDTWTDKEGKERTTVGVIADDVVFLSSGKGAGGAHEASSPSQPAGGLDDSDIPF